MSKSNPTASAESLQSPVTKFFEFKADSDDGGTFAYYQRNADGQGGAMVTVNDLWFIPLETNRWKITGYSQRLGARLWSREYPSNQRDNLLLEVYAHQNRDAQVRGVYSNAETKDKLKAIGAKYQSIVYGYMTKLNGDNSQRELIAIGLAGSSFGAWVDFCKGKCPDDLTPQTAPQFLGDNWAESAYGDNICNFFVQFDSKFSRKVKNGATKFKVPSLRKLKIVQSNYKPEIAEKMQALDAEATKVDAEILQPFLNAYDAVHLTAAKQALINLSKPAEIVAPPQTQQAAPQQVQQSTPYPTAATAPPPTAFDDNFPPYNAAPQQAPPPPPVDDDLPF